MMLVLHFVSHPSGISINKSMTNQWADQRLRGGQQTVPIVSINRSSASPPLIDNEKTKGKQSRVARLAFRLLVFAFWLLPFDFCLLTFAFSSFGF